MSSEIIVAAQKRSKRDEERLHPDEITQRWSRYTSSSMEKEARLCQTASQSEVSRTSDAIFTQLMELGNLYKQRLKKGEEKCKSLTTMHYQNSHTQELYDAVSCKGSDTQNEDRASGFVGFKFRIYFIINGHGGSEASHFLSQNCVTFLINRFKALSELTPPNIFQALKYHYQKLDQALSRNHLFSGASASMSIIVIVKDALYVANAGVCRVLLLRKEGEAFACTEDALLPKYIKDSSCNPNQYSTNRFVKECHQRVQATRKNGEIVLNPLFTSLDKRRWWIHRASKGTCILNSLGGFQYRPLTTFEPKIAGPYLVKPGDRILAFTGISEIFSFRQVAALANNHKISQADFPKTFMHLTLGSLRDPRNTTIFQVIVGTGSE